MCVYLYIVCVCVCMCDIWRTRACVCIHLAFMSVHTCGYICTYITYIARQG